MKTFNLFNQRILLVLLPSLAPLVSQALGMVMEKRGVQSPATCLVNYGWMDNSVQQSPCYVAGWLLGQCNEGGVLLHPLHCVSVPAMNDVIMTQMVSRLDSVCQYGPDQPLQHAQCDDGEPVLVLVGRVQYPTSLCTVSSRSRLDHFYVSDLSRSRILWRSHSILAADFVCSH